MSDCYYFPGQFKCMYCKVNLDPDGTLCLSAGDNIDLTCPKCNATWKFFTHVQLNLKLVRGGRHNSKNNLKNYDREK